MMKAILYAFLAAVFYAINILASKVLLRDVGPTTMAALLYLGAGIGIAIPSFLNTHDRKASAPLTRRDMPFVVGMIVLDIAAPIRTSTPSRISTAATSTRIRSRIPTDTTISERTAHTPTGILPPYLNANLSAKIKTRKQ